MKKKLLALASMVPTLLAASTAFAQEGVSATNRFDVGVALALGAGLGIGIAAFGGALGQGRTAAAALEGIARNPNASGKIFVPMILGLALIESLVIYALIIAFLLQGQLPS
jgi:F-type H+-transporting ATPase subunit c